MNDAAPAEPAFALSGSRGFAGWLAETGASLAITTYQTGKLLLLGTENDGAICAFDRAFPRPMGLAVRPDGRGFALVTQYQIQIFDDRLAPDARDASAFDAVYAPHVAWVTGAIDAHDVGFDAAGRPVFITTLYSCIAAVSDRHNFRPLWRPPFVSDLVAEDRCHLNGLAMAEGRPRYVTAVSRTDGKDGWRAQRSDGGVVIDVETSEIVAAGLAMPHSPRLYQGRLWVLNSGAGEFGHVDLATGRFEGVAFCPGYARGLSFVGPYAIVGLSQPRKDDAFSGLPIDAALAARGIEALCGIAIIDLRRGEMVEWLRIRGEIRELYDIAVLPGVRQPSVIGFKTDEVKRTVSIEAMRDAGR